jgi:hypothetical protein
VHARAVAKELVGQPVELRLVVGEAGIVVGFPPATTPPSSTSL